MKTREENRTIEERKRKWKTREGKGKKSRPDKTKERQRKEGKREKERTEAARCWPREYSLTLTAAVQSSAAFRAESLQLQTARSQPLGYTRTRYARTLWYYRAHLSPVILKSTPLHPVPIIHMSNIISNYVYVSDVYFPLQLSDLKVASICRTIFPMMKWLEHSILLHFMTLARLQPTFSPHGQSYPYIRLSPLSWPWTRALLPKPPHSGTRHPAVTCWAISSMATPGGKCLSKHFKSGDSTAKL